MEVLYTKIRAEVTQWKKDNYKSDESDKSVIEEIAQILNYQFIDEHKTALRYLRKPQFEAIETYLYLRFVKQTPHIIDLYKSYYPKPSDLLEALGINLSPRRFIRYFC